MVYHYPLRLAAVPAAADTASQLCWEIDTVPHELYSECYSRCQGENDADLDKRLSHVGIIVQALESHCRCTWCDKFESFNRGLGLTIELFSTPLYITSSSAALLHTPSSDIIAPFSNLT
uniref:Prenyl transferase n=1 Tax=Lygus hesperus TaxID=30085 RepID=A0A0A9XTC4_LYGHE